MSGGGGGQARVAVKLEECVRELTYSQRNSHDSYTRCRNLWFEMEEMLDFSGFVCDYYLDSRGAAETSIRVGTFWMFFG